MTRFKLGNIVHDCTRPHEPGELVSLSPKVSRIRVNGVTRRCSTERLRLGFFRKPPVQFKYPAAIRQAAARFGLTPRQYLQASE